MKDMKRIVISVLILFIFLASFPHNAFAEEEKVLSAEPGGVPFVNAEKFAGKINGRFGIGIPEGNTQEESGDTAPESTVPGKTAAEDNIPEDTVHEDTAPPEVDSDKIMAEEFIDAVRRLGFITLDDENAVVDAIRFYESLSDLAKDMAADAKRRLDEAVSIIKYLQSEDEKLKKSEEKFTLLTEKLAYIETITPDMGHEALGSEITALEEIYATLSDEEKLVYDERLLMEGKPVYGETLAVLKDTFANRQEEYDMPFVNAAKEKLELISGYEFSDGHEILKAQTDEFIALYETLSPSQKELFEKNAGNYDEIILSLNKKLASWQTASDMTALSSLLTQISQIEKITPAHEELILSAKDALDLLDDKSAVDPALLSVFDKAYAELTKALEDEKIAGEVSLLIDSIGEISLDSKEALDDARLAYDSLTDGQKEYVTNYDILLSKEEEYKTLTKEKITADELIAQIDSLGEITLEKEAEISALREKYDALSEKAKAFVTNIDLLVSAESTLGDIKAADEVTRLIEYIGEVSTDKLALIRSAREKYDTLTDTGKALVENLSVLEAAEEILKDHIAAEKADRLISKLPQDATFGKEDAIFSAMDYYNSLTDNQKALVKNPEKIISLYDEMISMRRKLEDYLEKHGETSVYIEDMTGYVTITASIGDFLTVEDKDLIASGKTILYTVTSFCEEFSYEDVNVTILPTEPEEVVFSPFYYVHISRAVADVDEDGVISDDSYETVKEIPGTITVEITLSEDLLPQTSEITRLFTGLVSPYSEAGNFSRIMDTDTNMNTMTFTVNGSVSIIPSFIDIMNPMTGDNATVYIIFGAFAVILTAVLVLKKKTGR